MSVWPCCHMSDIHLWSGWSQETQRTWRVCKWHNWYASPPTCQSVCPSCISLEEIFNTSLLKPGTEFQLSWHYSLSGEPPFRLNRTTSNKSSYQRSCSSSCHQVRAFSVLISLWALFGFSFSLISRYQSTPPWVGMACSCIFHSISFPMSVVLTHLTHVSML